MQNFFDRLDHTLIEIGEWSVTWITIIQIVLLPVLVLVTARFLNKLVRNTLERQNMLDRGVQNAITKITYYTFIALGFAWILSAIGAPLAGLAVFGGGLGIGIGIGLQEALKNFFSGLVILLTRHIRPGDRIVMVDQDLQGNVQDIGTYSTRLRTIEDAVVIVPNSNILNNEVVNWTLNAERRMVEVPIGVHYNSDVELVRELLLQAAKESPEVLDYPPPEVLLTQFGNSSIDFILLAWTETQVFRPRRLNSDVYFRAWRLFKEHGVQIPYPQRDVHIIDTPEGSQS